MKEIFKMVGKIEGFKTTYYEDKKGNKFLSYNETIKIIESLSKQLQAYKDKENKLREFLENETNDLYSITPTKKYWVIDILQILNEGSDIDA